MPSSSLPKLQLDARGFRNQRFAFAVGGSLISKGLAFVTQFLAIPFAIHWCGIDVFTLYLSLVAGSLAPSMVLLRLGPRFVGRIAAFHSEGDTQAIAAYFRSSIFLTCISCLLATLLNGVLILTPQFRSIYSDLSGDGVVLPLCLLGAFWVIGALCQTVEQVQCGFHETHLITVRAAIANVLSCILLLTVLPSLPNIITLILILQAIPLASRLLSAMIFISRYRKTLFERQPFSGKVHVLSDSLRFTFIAGFCAYMGVQAPLLILSTQAASTPIAHASAISLQLVLQLLGVASVLLVPSIPAIASAWMSADYDSVKRYRNGILRTLYVFSTAIVFFGATAGYLFAHKIGLDSFSGMIVFGAAGFFFTVCVAEQFYFTYLLTIYQESQTAIVYTIVGLKSVFVVAGALISVSVDADLYALLIICLIAFFTSIVPLTFIEKVHRTSFMKLRSI